MAISDDEKYARLIPLATSRLRVINAILNRTAYKSRMFLAPFCALEKLVFGVYRVTFYAMAAVATSANNGSIFFYACLQ